jgi:S-adenosylmethionine synthetase
MKDPMSFYIETHDSALSRKLTQEIQSKVDLTPMGIIKHFDLFRPIYSQTTNYGHFGKADLPWERVDLF